MIARVRRLGLPTVIALYLLLAGFYSVIIPPFETPDEIWHFAFIQHLATGQGLPVSEPNTQAMWRQQGVQAPGYYLASAALTSWIDQSDFLELFARANPHRAIGQPDTLGNRNYLIHHADEGWPWRNSVLALHVARFFSIALGALTLWAIYETLCLVLDPDSALLGVALIAFIPQFIFISAAVSNDNAVNALAALVLWRLVRLVVRAEPPAVRDLWLLGLLLGLAVLSKLSALGLIGLAGLTLLLAAWRLRSWRLFGQAALFVGLPVLAIGGWWYARNFQLYGDPLAWNIWQQNILLRVVPAGWRTIAGELVSLERSFWGLFGWLNLPYPDIVYIYFHTIEILILGGLALAGVRWLASGRPVDRRWWGSALLLLWLAILTVSWLRFMRIAPAAQGRYFFAAAPTLAMLAALGLRAWRTPIFGVVAAISLLALSALTPFWIIQPAYSPAIAAAERASLTDMNARFSSPAGDEFALVGFAASPQQLMPGQAARVTLEWRALAPGETDYSIFVHLVSDEGLVIAQADTMPGGGLRPTSQWTPGEQRIEEYWVQIPETAYTPDQGQWAVGLYDHRDGSRLSAVLENGPVEAEEGAVRFDVVSLVAPGGGPPNPMDMAFDDNIALVGYEVSQRILRSGDAVEVTLYWQARGPIAENYTTFVHLLNTEFDSFGGDDGTPDLPTTEWGLGSIVPDIHRFTVSDAALPGQYQLEIGLYTRPDFDRLSLKDPEQAEGADRLLLGPLQVTE